MGTRADFYVGREPETMEWLGSVAWDGDRGTMANDGLFDMGSEGMFRTWVKSQQRDDLTLPEDGWPWPWEDSRTTDYAYAWDDGKVWWSCFGSPWCDDFKVDETPEGPKEVFPDMTDVQNIQRGGIKSGLVTVTSDERGTHVE